MIKMKCVRCGSLRMVRFLDGFGERRIFCRKCWGSYLVNRQFNGQKKLEDFNIQYRTILERRDKM